MEPIIRDRTVQWRTHARQHDVSVFSIATTAQRMEYYYHWRKGKWTNQNHHNDCAHQAETSVWLPHVSNTTAQLCLTRASAKVLAHHGRENAWKLQVYTSWGHVGADSVAREYQMTLTTRDNRCGTQEADLRWVPEQSSLKTHVSRLSLKQQSNFRKLHPAEYLEYSASDNPQAECF